MVVKSLFFWLQLYDTPLPGKRLNYYILYGQVCTCKACKKLAAKT